MNNEPKFSNGTKVWFLLDGEELRGRIEDFRCNMDGTIDYIIKTEEGTRYRTAEIYLSKTARMSDKKTEDKTETRMDYYQLPNGCQAWDVARYLDFNCGVAVKYECRAGRKHELGMTDKEKQIEDLNKAMDHLFDEITNVLGGECKYKLK